MPDLAFIQAPTSSPAWISPLITAVASLIGVVVGAGLTQLREVQSQARKERKDAAYLVVKVAGELDRFADCCVDVVQDDGWYRGRRGENDCLEVQVSTPKLDLDSFQVDWRSLPPSLMYPILDLPNRVITANRIISEASQEAIPPDFDEMFEQRQFQYAALGLEAISLASKLRKHAKFPERERGEWDPVAYMQAEKDRIEGRWTAQAET